MHVALLDSWPQDVSLGSGTAAAIGGLRHALVHRGHRVTRLSPDAPRASNSALSRLLFNLELPARLRALQFDLAIGFDIDGFLWSVRRPNAPTYLCSVKGVIAEELRHERIASRWVLEVLAVLERCNCRNADAVITTSEYCRDSICLHYGVPRSRIVLVPEGIDFARWHRIAMEKAVSCKGATILCVARQYPRKHIADLLLALPIVRKAVPHVRATIVGDGPKHGELVELANSLSLQGVVNFTGVLSYGALARAYASADVFCLPSVQEGFGIVFLEAMACGLPIVATNAAAIPEVVPQDRAGRLTPPGDIAALANALITILQDSNLRAAYSAYGQLHAALFDWHRVATIFLTQIEAFLQ